MPRGIIVAGAAILEPGCRSRWYAALVGCPDANVGMIGMTRQMS